MIAKEAEGFSRSCLGSVPLPALPLPALPFPLSLPVLLLLPLPVPLSLPVLLPLLLLLILTATPLEAYRVAGCCNTCNELEGQQSHAKLEKS